MAGFQDRNQERVLDGAIEGDRRITVFLKNGVPMKGRVLAHDSYTIFMETDKHQALIYKHSVTSMFPARISKPGEHKPRSGGPGRPGGRPPRGTGQTRSDS